MALKISRNTARKRAEALNDDRKEGTRNRWMLPIKFRGGFQPDLQQNDTTVIEVAANLYAQPVSCSAL